MSRAARRRLGRDLPRGAKNTATVFAPGAYGAYARCEPFAIGTNVTHIQIEIDSTELTAETLTFEISFFLSLDGGLTWQDFGSASGRGGVNLGKQGEPLDWAGLIISLPEPENASRQGRVALIFSEAVKTEGRVTLS